MRHSITIWKVKWIHFENPKTEELIQISEEYDLHEIITEDIIDPNTQDKVDTYEDLIFMVLHFPKYDIKNKRHSPNELNFILWKDFIITIASIQSNNIERIRTEYIDEANDTDDDEKYKITPYYIMYKIIDAMYDKTIVNLWKSNRDILRLEEQVFANNWVTKELLEDIMIKKRNLVFLKHNFIFQSEILEEVQKPIEKLYEWQLDLYFEDLSYKLDKIDNNITVQSKNINSLTEAYNSLMNIRLNSILTKLTVFTLVIWIWTFIAWLYWMNVALPMEDWASAFWILFILMIFLSAGQLYFFKKNGWFH